MLNPFTSVFGANERLEKQSLHMFLSPLRYPGGKGPVAHFVKSLILRNDLRGGDYAETYAGGASVAWALLFEDYVEKVHINDSDIAIYSFWKSVLDHTDELCSYISSKRVTMTEWYRQKAVNAHPSDHSTLEIGFSTFFLNRTNRSGIIKAGVIGGKNQEGKWKLDARFNKIDLIGRIQRIANLRSRIKIYNLDAVEFISTTAPKLPTKTLLFLDPPYFVKGSQLYQNSYTLKDHEEVAAVIQGNSKKHWIVSYDAAKEIIRLYSEKRRIRYDLSYSAQIQYFGTEVMFFSDNLLIPKINSPVKIKADMVKDLCSPNWPLL